ncbi:cytochrome c biogenesis protein ResB [Arthrobacter antibioticus]|uniref:cytochrome c biogenesis protein ResB n=1 Tax=Arthrobacter sp. H35-MC1 TaxID=3046203 RepID=UPI0024BA9B26|nr:cytochrome c biogenesis protein ResB [Arthrobacter sp. H35-MC1]MDJ0317903.1 cytochrome c biogenesis protein ResB [Arthrobacter sp. H35-MC1]
MKETVVKEAKSKKPKTSGQEAVLPQLGFVGMLRWAWRQLTSMRTALFLLLMLAVAAVPGSLFPQRPSAPAEVAQYLKDNPGSGPVMDWFKLFDVYSSPWFAAIYLLLFTSLVGCVLPRAKIHWKAMRSAPPRTPKRLSRLAEYGTVEIPAGSGIDAETAVKDAADILKSRRYRVDVRDLDTDRPSVGAEVGFLKEVGNLLFHTAMIGVLAAIAFSGLFGYSGQRVLVEGETFVNTLTGYDTFTPGANFSDESLSPYSVQLDRLVVKYDRSTEAHYGQPLDFNATLTLKDKPGAAPEKKTLKVNEPVAVGGTNVYLVGNGYAPIITVKDGQGKVAFQGPVITIPTDGAYTSLMVVKVPDAKPKQLGFVGFFLPTALIDEKGVAFGSDPDPFNPQLNLNAYTGDLGLDNGVPRNVYTLDTSELKEINSRSLDSGGIVLVPGQSYTLPEGSGTISFDGIKRFAALDIRHDPGQVYVLVFALIALAGLMGSLFLNRRRVWVRTGNHPDGRTMVEFGLLARGEDHRLAGEYAAINKALHAKWLVPFDVAGQNGEQAQPIINDSAQSVTAASKDQ